MKPRFMGRALHCVYSFTQTGVSLGARSKWAPSSTASSTFPGVSHDCRLSDETTGAMDKTSAPIGP